MNTTIFLTATLLVTRVVVGWQLEEEPRVVDPDREPRKILVCIHIYRCTVNAGAFSGAVPPYLTSYVSPVCRYHAGMCRYLVSVQM